MTPTLVLVGALSVYAPDDGHNGGTLACGGAYRWNQHHIAIRSWRRVGCGATAKVCVCARVGAGQPRHAAGQSGAPRRPRRCVWTEVRDSGPWGLQCGRRWRVWTKHRVPRGCRRRAVVDLSYALWRALGSPKFLTKVRIEVY